MGCNCKKKREVVQQAPPKPPSRITLTEMPKPQPAQPVPQPSADEIVEKLENILNR